MTERDFSVEDRLAAAATLPSWCYTDPEVLSRERESVFGRTWQLVGRQDQVASPGQFFTATVGQEPLLLARGADGNLDALSNVCRHRAGPVARGELPRVSLRVPRLDYARYTTETRSFYSLQRSPVKEDAPGRLRRVEEGGGAEVLYFWIYPNLMLNVYSDNFSTNLVLPLGHERTLTVFDWFFREPERPEARKTLEETVDFSDEIQREDIAICEAVQKGLTSRTYDRGRYSVRRENGVHHFHVLYAKAMASRETGIGNR